MRYLAAALLLVLLAAPSWGQASRDFDDTNDEVNCGDITALEAIPNFSVGAWVYLDDDPTAVEGVVGKGSAGEGWTLSVSATEKLTFNWQDSTSGRVAVGATSITLATWQCVVATYDRSLGSSRGKVFLNGVQDGASNGTNSDITGGTAAVRVGFVSSGGSRWWDGKIAHVFAEARTWTAVEVAEFCRGNITQAQRAAGGTGGYLPLWDNGATPTPYIGQGVFAGVCDTTDDPAVSSDGPPVFIPGGGQ